MNQLEGKSNIKKEQDLNITCPDHCGEMISQISINRQVDQEQLKRVFCKQCPLNGIQSRGLPYVKKEYQKYFLDLTNTQQKCFSNIKDFQSKLKELAASVNERMRESLIGHSQNLEISISQVEKIKSYENFNLKDLVDFAMYLSKENHEKEQIRKEKEQKYDKQSQEIFQKYQNDIDGALHELLKLQGKIDELFVLKSILNQKMDSGYAKKNQPKVYQPDAKSEQISTQKIVCKFHESQEINNLIMSDNTVVRSACKQCLCEFEENHLFEEYPKVLQESADAFRVVYEKNLKQGELNTCEIIELLNQNSNSIRDLQIENSLFLVQIKEIENNFQMFKKQNQFQHPTDLGQLESLAEYLYELFYKQKDKQNKTNYQQALQDYVFDTLNHFNDEFSKKLYFRKQQYQKIYQAIIEQFKQLSDKQNDLQYQFCLGVINSAHLQKNKLYLVRPQSIVIYENQNDKLLYHDTIYPDFKILNFRIRNSLDFFIIQKKLNLLSIWSQNQNKQKEYDQVDLLTEENMINFYVEQQKEKEKIIYVINQTNIRFALCQNNVWKFQQQKIEFQSQGLIMLDTISQTWTFFLGNKEFIFIPINQQNQNQKEKINPNIQQLKDFFKDENFKCWSYLVIYKQQNSKQRGQSNPPKSISGTPKNQNIDHLELYILSDKFISVIQVDPQKPSIKCKNKFHFNQNQKIFGMHENQLYTIQRDDTVSPNKIIYEKRIINDKEIIGYKHDKDKVKNCQVINYLGCDQHEVIFLTLDMESRTYLFEKITKAGIKEQVSKILQI